MPDIRRQVPEGHGPRTHPPDLSEGVIAGGFIHLAVVRGRGDTTEAQARSAFESIKDLLGRCGGTLDHVVKVTVYFQDLQYRAGFGKVWAEYFGTTNPPARTAIQVANASPMPGGPFHFALDVLAVEPR
ncbi:MAG: RidA family protein [SAR202 cluster bacterium]|nr:RidA family protein [SAR202 cluster bacterium]